ncbi:MAG TPA: carboxymuconolactone decarboxylase family protein [Trebonia sp.]|jgi:hypothetical protein
MSAPSGYKQSVVVPLPSDGDIRAVIGEDYDPDTRLNVLKMFAGTGEFYPALIDMVRTVFGCSDIDDKHREMIILRAASILDVPYEWQANKVMASNAGLTETLSTLLDTFGQVVTRKYIVTISWFSMLSLFLNATRTPLETTDKLGTRTSPLG